MSTSARRGARRYRKAIAGGGRFVRETERMENERRRVVPRIVGPMAVMKACLPESRGRPIEQLANICKRQAGAANPGFHGRQSNRPRLDAAAVG